MHQRQFQSLLIMNIFKVTKKPFPLEYCDSIRKNHFRISPIWNFKSLIKNIKRRDPKKWGQVPTFYRKLKINQRFPYKEDKKKGRRKIYLLGEYFPKKKSSDWVLTSILDDQVFTFKNKYPPRNIPFGIFLPN